MQQITQTLAEAIRSSYQIPIANVEVYNRDGSLYGSISADVLDIDVDIKSNDKVPRTFSISLNNKDGKYTPDPQLFDKNIIWYNKEIIIYLGYQTDQAKQELLPQGRFVVDTIAVSKNPSDHSITVKGQGVLSKLYEDAFEQMYFIDDPYATESMNYALVTNGAASPEASSYMQAGDEIQRQARIHYIKTKATINGLEHSVVNELDSDSRKMIGFVQNDTKTGTWRELGRVDFKTWNTADWRLHPVAVTGSGASVADPNTSDGRALEYNGYFWGYTKYNLDFNPGKLYRIRARYKRIQNPGSGTNAITIGIIGFADDGDISINSVGEEDSFINHHHICVNETQPALGSDYVESVGYFKGFGKGNNTGPHPDINSPATLYPGIRYIRPLLMTGYKGGGISRIDYIVIEELEDPWIFQYTPGAYETVRKLESEIFVDMQEPEDLQNISIELWQDTKLSDFVYYSPDNQTWYTSSSLTFVPSSLVQFIKFKVKSEDPATNGSFQIGVQEIRIKTKRSYPALLATDNSGNNFQVTSWRPMPGETNPFIMIDLRMVRAINCIKLQWGRNSGDFWNQVKYYIEVSTDKVTWHTINDANDYEGAEYVYGNIEHVIMPESPRYIRIQITGVLGLAILRHIVIQKNTTQKGNASHMYEIIKGTGFTAGSTVFFPITQRFTRNKNIEIGTEKGDVIRELSFSSGWGAPFDDELGVLRAERKKINPHMPAWDFRIETDNILSFSPTFTNDIKNVIIVTYENSDQKAIVGTAIDDNPLSPTSIQRLGRRVVKYSGESYDTQEKCDQIARDRLFDKTRFKHSVDLPVTGHPALQINDVIRVTVNDTGVNETLYLITGISHKFSADPRSFETKFDIAQLF